MRLLFVLLFIFKRLVPFMFCSSLIPRILLVVYIDIS